MRIPRGCKTCEVQFEAIKETQFFCSRKCFRKDYYARKKLEAKVERPFPNYNCGNCGRISPLDFDPLKSPLLFEAYMCPFCDDTREERWKERNLPYYKRKREAIVQVGVYTSVGHALFVARAQRVMSSLSSSG
jgi:hypothetical protein